MDQLKRKHQSNIDDQGPAIKMANITLQEPNPCTETTRRSTSTLAADGSTQENTNRAAAGLRIINNTYGWSKKYGVANRNVTLQVSEPDISENPYTYLHRVVDEILEYVASNVQPSDMVGLSINNKLSGHPPIIISLRRADQLTTDVVLTTVEAVQQSNKAFFITGPLEVRVMHVQIESQVGHGGLPKYQGTTKMYSIRKNPRHKSSIINIKMIDDSLNLERALVVGQAFCHKTDSEEARRRYETLRRKDGPKTRAAIKLNRDAGIVPSAELDTYRIQRLQDHLQDYCITIYDKADGRSVMYEGPTSKSRRHIDIMIGERGELSVITSLTGAFSTHNYCRPCKQPYQRSQTHVCR